MTIQTRHPSSERHTGRCRGQMCLGHFWKCQLSEGHSSGRLKRLKWRIFGFQIAFPSLYKSPKKWDDAKHEKQFSLHEEQDLTLVQDQDLLTARRSLGKSAWSDLTRARCSCGPNRHSNKNANMTGCYLCALLTTFLARWHDVWDQQ